jgi:hypothetical protein
VGALLVFRRPLPWKRDHYILHEGRTLQPPAMAERATILAVHGWARLRTIPTKNVHTTRWKHTIITLAMSLRLVEGGASDGCRPKLHRWPFRVRYCMPRSTALPHLTCLAPAWKTKKGAYRGRLLEERVGWCLHNMNGLTPWSRSVAIASGL